MDNIMDEKCSVDVISLGDLQVLYCGAPDLTRTRVTRFISARLQTVYEVSDITSAPKIVDTTPLDLVIIDTSLIKGSVAEFSKAIRSISSDIAVAYICEAEHLVNTYRESTGIGVSKYFVHPFSLEELMAHLVEVSVNVEKQHYLKSIALPAVNNEESYESEKVKQYVSNYMKNTESVSSIRHISFPMAEISGDFHTVAKYENSYYIMLADAIGHGLPAILPALQIPNIFKSFAKKGFSLLAIADELNHVLFNQGFTEHFVAASFILVNTDDNQLSVLNCGNPNVLVISEHGGILYKFESVSFALGMVSSEQINFNLKTVECTEDSFIYAFTDGLLETLKQTDQGLSFSSLNKVFLEKSPDYTFDHIQFLIKNSMLNGRVDDLSLLEIAYKPNSCQKRTLPSAPNKEVDENTIPKRIIENNAVLYFGSQDYLTVEAINELKHKLGRIYFLEWSANSLGLMDKTDVSAVVIGFELSKSADQVRHIRSMMVNVPIVLIGRDIQSQSIEQVMNAGASKYVHSPIDVPSLIEIVQQCITQYRGFCETELLASIYQTSSLAVTVTNKERQLVYVNPAFCTITGYSQEEVLGRNPKLLSSGMHDEKFYDDMWSSILEGMKWSGEIWNRRKNGALFLEWITISAIRNKDGKITHYFSIFSDITTKKVSENLIHKLTYIDELTELPNRRFFIERLDRELKQTNRKDSLLIVMFLDVDGFRYVNESLGHRFGDLVLQQIVKRIARLLEGTETFARISSDEFGICFPEITDIKDLDVISEKILSEVAKPFQVGKEVVHLSISIGVAVYPNDAMCPESLLKVAEQAMFYAKKNGRNRANHYQPYMQEYALAKKDLIRDLHEAIQKNQFFVEFQPIVDLVDGVIHKAEALIRWDHPTRGVVSPVDFIPIAEETGMISVIGDWVFREVIPLVKGWQKKYQPDLQISINKSPRQFRDDRNNHQGWHDFLQSNGFPASSIVVEITEGLLMDKSSYVVKQLETLRKASIQIALDDFGTGYSSLAYLKDFELDYLKIDKSFISNLTGSLADKSLCEAIIIMAHKLGIKVVAEGIECKEQQQFLLEAGCDYGQGYFFSRPLKPEAFESLLKAFTQTTKKSSKT